MTIALVGLLPIVRFLWFWAAGEGSGHIQSLILGGSLSVLGVLVAIMGMLADLIGANRKLLEATLAELRQLDRRLADRDEAVAPTINRDKVA